MIKKQKKLFIVVMCVAVIFISVGVGIFLNLRSDDEADVIEIMEDESVQKIKNVNGIAEYIFSEDDLESESRIEIREVDGVQKKCMVIILNDDAWSRLPDERRDEIMKGFINTSRLQIDRESGCVIVEYQDEVMSEGFWRSSGGYVIIQK